MKTEYDSCVGCVPEMGCLGSACPQRYVRTECDYCGSLATYCFEGEDVCDDCLNRLLDDVWEELDLSEKAELLGAERELSD